MQQKFVIAFAVSMFFGLLVIIAPKSVSADTTKLTNYSWDQGLFATKGRFNDTSHAWGSRKTSGAWGTGSVNYQSGSTTVYRGKSSGTLNVVLRGTYCPNNQCKYGSGSGYKSLVQLWNDSGNYIAFGLINDPGVSPTGTTLMIEGAANGKPVGGYWAGNGITGTSHHFKIKWSSRGISLTIDNNVTVGPYPVKATGPSISFLSAARDKGDIVDTTFSGITFSTNSVVADAIIEPSSAPYLTYSATLTETGTGTGHSSYINAHDAYNNAIGVGIQTDTASPESNGQPYFIWQRVQDGIFTFNYISPATSGPEPVTLKWWKNEKLAVFYKGATPIANISLNLQPRLFFNAEGNARKNGDSVDSTVTNTQISVGTNCPNYCGLNGSWNTNDFNFYGLTATNTNGFAQNGANFRITGTVSGLPSGGDWDNHLVAGIGMIAQYWNGQ